MSAIYLKRKILPSSAALPKRRVRVRKRFSLPFTLKKRWVLPALSFVLVVNFFGFNYHRLLSFFDEPVVESPKELYLIKEASEFIKEREPFETGVKGLAHNLNIPAEWLMAVMYMESRFNPAIRNHKGSGAVGLIQFMVPTVKELNLRLGKKLYMEDIERMSAHEQLELVQGYLETVRERYGEFHSLTDLYLAILYPKAINRSMEYKLFSKPSKRYRQNSGLDGNRDGIVSVQDIDNRMKRMFPTAYHTRKPGL